MSEDDYLSAEARARKEIDRQLVACGWLVQNRADMNLYARQGVAVREFIMARGHGRADYLLFLDGKAVGAIEAKPSGTPLARSVLRAAFEGRLVSHPGSASVNCAGSRFRFHHSRKDPTDEPASALLERIRGAGLDTEGQAWPDEGERMMDRHTRQVPSIGPVVPHCRGGAS